MAYPWQRAGVRLPRVSIPRGVKIGMGATVMGLVVLGQAMVFVGEIRTGHVLDPNGAALRMPHSGTLTHRLTVALAAALGPSDRGVRRYRVVSVRPDSRHPRLKVVNVAWAINNDLSFGTIGNGAQIDAYLILRTIYGTGLPVDLANLEGTYPGARRAERAVMRISMDRQVAQTIAADAGWANIDAQTMWPLVHVVYIDPDFQPQSTQ